MTTAEDTVVPAAPAAHAGVLAELLAAQRRILTAAVAGAPCDELLDMICLEIERLDPGGICTIMRPGPDGLQFRAAPSVPTELGLDSCVVPVGMGTCGAAFETGETTIVTDTRTDPLWADLQDLVDASGIRACWSIPIRSEGAELLGTFAISHKKPGGPDTRHLSMLETAASIAAIAMQRHSERAARQHAEAQLRSIAENVPDFIMLIDLDGTLLFINRTVPHLDVDTVLGTRLFDYVDPRFHAPMRDCFQRVVETGAPDRYTVTYRDRDGVDRVFESRVGPIVKDGAINALAVISSDMTEHLGIQEALRQSTERFRQLAECSPCVVFQTDAQGMTLYVNHRWHELTGQDEGDWRGERWAEALHPDDRERIVNTWRETVANGKSYRNEYRVICADGEPVWVLVAAEPTHDDDGTLRGFIGTCTDVHALKQAEQEILESRERFRQVTETIRDVFYLLEHPAGTVRYVSPGYERIWGRSCHSLRDHPDRWQTSIHPDDLACFLDARREPLDRDAHEAEYRILRPDGELRWIHDKWFPVRSEDGTVIRIAGVAADVTERKRHEQELQRRSETEHLLLRELDHRVRNNLSSLVTLIDATRRGATDVDAFAHAIAGRVHAMATVHSLLSRSSWTRIELGALLDALVPPDVNGTLHHEGAAVEVPAAQASSLAMVLHELVVNSQKYGALGVADGRVVAHWNMTAEDGPHRELALIWDEHGGPAIETPPEPGVGTSLIDGLVRSDLRGEVALSYPVSGARHEILMRLG